ncbi:hypothetical protein DEU56DRAFT_760644 [Suillus clintonianus]|uniref:uncharacterized protein n=1 Tax=Suillus clintonianus TaxID=1904413 RepID=UPI001B85B8D1|nr:uncharacterized protein DEU56DRAFT_760644 [Suillus clintonianus]KAG2121471.1 hypothetical protein DEU56DRAFT_760644 [Suillus clintonianus]
MLRIARVVLKRLISHPQDAFISASVPISAYLLMVNGLPASGVNDTTGIHPDSKGNRRIFIHVNEALEDPAELMARRIGGSSTIDGHLAGCKNEPVSFVQTGGILKRSDTTSPHTQANVTRANYRIAGYVVSYGSSASWFRSPTQCITLNSAGTQVQGDPTICDHVLQHANTKQIFLRMEQQVARHHPENKLDVSLPGSHSDHSADHTVHGQPQVQEKHVALPEPAHLDSTASCLLVTRTIQEATSHTAALSSTGNYLHHFNYEFTERCACADMLELSDNIFYMAHPL